MINLKMVALPKPESAFLLTYGSRSLSLSVTKNPDGITVTIKNLSGEKAYFIGKADLEFYPKIQEEIQSLLKEKSESNLDSPLHAARFNGFNQKLNILKSTIALATQTASDLANNLEINLIELFKLLLKDQSYTIDTNGPLTLFTCGRPQPKTEWTPEEHQLIVEYQTQLIDFVRQTETSPLPALPNFLENLLLLAERSVLGTNDDNRVRLEQTDEVSIRTTLVKLFGSRLINDPTGGSDSARLLDKFCAEKGIDLETWTLNLARGFAMLNIKEKTLREMIQDSLPEDCEAILKKELGLSPEASLLDFLQKNFPDMGTQKETTIDHGLTLIMCIQSKEFILGLTNGARGRLKNRDFPSGQCGQELSKRAYNFIEDQYKDKSVTTFSGWIQQQIYQFRVEVLRSILVTSNRENTGFETIKNQIESMAEPHIALHSQGTPLTEAQGTPLTEAQVNRYFNQVSLERIVEHIQIVLQKAEFENLNLQALLRSEGQEETTSIFGMISDKKEIYDYLVRLGFCTPAFTQIEDVLTRTDQEKMIVLFAASLIVLKPEDLSVTRNLLADHRLKDFEALDLYKLKVLEELKERPDLTDNSRNFLLDIVDPQGVLIETESEFRKYGVNQTDLWSDLTTCATEYHSNLALTVLETEFRYGKIDTLTQFAQGEPRLVASALKIITCYAKQINLYNRRYLGATFDTIQKNLIASPNQEILAELINCIAYQSETRDLSTRTLLNYLKSPGRPPIYPSQFEALVRNLSGEQPHIEPSDLSQNGDFTLYGFLHDIIPQLADPLKIDEFPVLMSQLKASLSSEDIIENQAASNLILLLGQSSENNKVLTAVILDIFKGNSRSPAALLIYISLVPDPFSHFSDSWRITQFLNGFDEVLKTSPFKEDERTFQKLDILIKSPNFYKHLYLAPDFVLTMLAFLDPKKAHATLGMKIEESQRFATLIAEAILNSLNIQQQSELSVGTTEVLRTCLSRSGMSIDMGQYPQLLQKSCIYLEDRLQESKKYKHPALTRRLFLETTQFIYLVIANTTTPLLDSPELQKLQHQLIQVMGNPFHNSKSRSYAALSLFGLNPRPFETEKNGYWPTNNQLFQHILLEAFRTVPTEALIYSIQKLTTQSADDLSDSALNRLLSSDILKYMVELLDHAEPKIKELARQFFDNIVHKEKITSYRDGLLDLVIKVLPNPLVYPDNYSTVILLAKKIHESYKPEYVCLNNEQWIRLSQLIGHTDPQITAFALNYLQAALSQGHNLGYDQFISSIEERCLSVLRIGDSDLIFGVVRLIETLSKGCHGQPTGASDHLVRELFLLLRSPEHNIAESAAEALETISFRHRIYTEIDLSALSQALCSDKARLVQTSLSILINIADHNPNLFAEVPELMAALNQLPQKDPRASYVASKIYRLEKVLSYIEQVGAEANSFNLPHIFWEGMAESLRSSEPDQVQTSIKCLYLLTTLSPEILRNGIRIPELLQGILKGLSSPQAETKAYSALILLERYPEAFVDRGQPIDGLLNGIGAALTTLPQKTIERLINKIAESSKNPRNHRHLSQPPIVIGMLPFLEHPHSPEKTQAKHYFDTLSRVIAQNAMSATHCNRSKRNATLMATFIEKLGHSKESRTYKVVQNIIKYMPLNEPLRDALNDCLSDLPQNRRDGMAELLTILLKGDSVFSLQTNRAQFLNSLLQVHDFIASDPQDERKKGLSRTLSRLPVFQVVTISNPEIEIEKRS